MSAPSTPTSALHPRLRAWFDERGWSAFAFQERAWAAHAEGRSGLVHAPTGMGKTLAVWLGAVSEHLVETAEADERGGAHEVTPGDAASLDRAAAEPLRVLWITPLRALASDTVASLQAPIDALRLPWTVEKRTGDTAQSLKAKQRRRLPTALVTTPESLSLLLSYPDAQRMLSTVRTVVVDEWHELLSSKRGSQTELALARLRRWNPSLRTWGLSATLGNLDEAMRTLVGVRPVGAPEPTLIAGETTKRTVIETVVPEDIRRFPSAGHLGLKILPRVLDELEPAASALVFCNTRSQVELWFGAISNARPDWLGRVSLHHGSLDRELRDKVEAGLREGRAKAVVCTSSLDLGVDFSPVDRVFQIGSPKGVARLLQRAGRSGHQPGATSRVVCVPTHAFELVEFAAARAAAERGEIEPRRPLSRPLDVLAQHVVTIALGGGFDERDLFDEVRTATSYRELTSTEWRWVLDFVTRGGPALDAYPEFKRVTIRDDDGRYVVDDRRTATMHRMAIGTITSDTAMAVRWARGGGTGSGGSGGGGRGSLGHIEESFVAKLRPGNRFVFAGRILELVRVRDMTAYVKRATTTKGVVPRWGGGRSPLSTMLARAVRQQLDAAREGVFASEEMRAVRPLLELQQRWSVLPEPGQLLIERTRTRDGHHAFIYPFEGRLVHEGLGAIVAHRLAGDSPVSINVTVNDYGVELLSSKPMELDEAGWRRTLRVGDLLDDMLRALNSNQLARRRFRDIARIAGLIHPGFPGAQGKKTRHLQASSELFFDVLSEFDPANLLLDQARREVLAEQLEVTRLRACLERIAAMELVIVETERLTPMSFPLFAETLRSQAVSSEKWSERIERMAAELEAEAGG